PTTLSVLLNKVPFISMGSMEGRSFSVKFGTSPTGSCRQPTRTVTKKKSKTKNFLMLKRPCMCKINSVIIDQYSINKTFHIVYARLFCIKHEANCPFARMCTNDRRCNGQWNIYDPIFF